MSDDNSTEHYRLFVAIQVPEAIRATMTGIQRELEKLLPNGAIRWTRPEQFHLTLRFLGDVPTNRVEELQQATRAVCADAPALHLRAQGLGFFPRSRSPRVAWIGVNDAANQLINLQKRIEEAVRTFTDQQGNERFSGHLTLGRFKQFKGLDTKRLAAHAERQEKHLFGEWQATQIEIMRSELSPTGARHSVLAAFQLGSIPSP